MTGNTLTVGPDGQFSDFPSAVAASQPSDRIEVQAGTYENQFASIPHSLTVVGVGGQAHFTATRQIPNGKGIFVGKRGVDHLIVENLTFSDASVSSRNGAGIRFEGLDLTVRNSVFRDNENGMLITPANEHRYEGTVIIENSQFVNNGYGDGGSHGMYFVHGGSLTVRDSEFLDTNRGHHVKSVARETNIIGNRFDDGSSNPSYSVDTSAGGDVLIDGNSFRQGPNADNKFLLNYDLNRNGVAGTLRITDNTVVNDRPGGDLLRNDSPVVAEISGNDLLGFDANFVRGPATLTDNTLDGAGLDDREYASNFVQGTDGVDLVEVGHNRPNGYDLGAGSDVFVSSVRAQRTVHAGDGDDMVLSNGGSDRLRGNDGADWLQAGGDNDTLYGDGGHDIQFSGNSQGTSSFGGAGDDILVGGPGRDRLTGGDGHDIFFPSRNVDPAVNGQAGDDVFIAGQAADHMGGGAGYDRSFMVGPRANFDQQQSTSSPVFFDEVGNTKYNHHNGIEEIWFEDGVFLTGTGEFISLADIPLPRAPDEVDISTLGGLSRLGDDATITAAPINNGTADNDTLDSAASIVEVLAGGAGDDRYDVDAGDIVIEAKGAGIDTVVSDRASVLPANVENFTLATDNGGWANGNDLANQITAGAGDDIVRGLGGDDTLIGGAGSDILIGGDGEDVIRQAGSLSDYQSYVVNGKTVYLRNADGDVDLLLSPELIAFDDAVFRLQDGALTETAVPTEPTPDPAPEPEPTPEPEPAPEPEPDPAPAREPQTLQVGEGESFASFEEAVAESVAGDRIQLDSGTYQLDAPIAIDHSLTIVGVDGRVVLNAPNDMMADEAVLMAGPKVGRLSLANLTIAGAEAADGTAAGLRFEGEDLLVSKSRFDTNEIGIAFRPADQHVEDADARITDTRFLHNGNGEPGYGIIATESRLVEISDTMFGATYGGDHLQSAAESTVVSASTFDDSRADTAYAIDIAGGGDLSVSGSNFMVGASSTSDAVIRYTGSSDERGAEISIADNLLLNFRAGLAVLDNDGVAGASVSNNQLFGVFGALIDGPGAVTGNTLNGAAVPDTTTVVNVAGEVHTAELMGASAEPVGTDTATALI